jgi:hypothetical protein
MPKILVALTATYLWLASMTRQVYSSRVEDFTLLVDSVIIEILAGARLLSAGNKL